MNNVKLSEYFWAIGLGRGAAATAAPEGGTLLRLAWIALARNRRPGSAGTLLRRPADRSWPVPSSRDFRRAMGRSRYWIVMLLLLMMLALPLKMILRWTVNLSYVVSIPEYFFNF